MQRPALVDGIEQGSVWSGVWNFFQHDVNSSLKYQKSRWALGRKLQRLLAPALTSQDSL